MTPLETVLSAYTFPPNIKVIHPTQVECINDLAPLQNSGSWLEMSCVDSETEYLTPTGWRRIADYASGPVAQFVPTSQGANGSGRLEFVQPLRYIKEACTEDMVRIKTNRSVSQKMTKDHRTVHVDYSGKWGESTAGAVLSEHNRLARGYKNRVVTTFDNFGGSGLNLTDAQLRVEVAAIADGHMLSWRKCAVRVKRPRKIERLRALLANAKIPSKELLEPYEGCEGFVRFTFAPPLGCKIFGALFWAATRAQLEIIVDEVRHWDSSLTKGPGSGFRFSTSQVESADFIQYALASVGVRSSLSRRDREREGRPLSIEYNVQAYHKTPLAYMCGAAGPSCDQVKTEVMWLEPATDGFKYCFTVPSSYLILRRDGAIFVTGNCGKTMIASAIGLYLKLTERRVCIVIMPPVLVPQWGRWLRGFTPALRVVEYKGNPKQRSALNLDCDFLLIGVQIFKKDYDRLQAFYHHRPYCVVIDEATMVANAESENHRLTHEFSVGNPTQVLSGTPMNKVMDVYGLVKYSAPGTYRNMRHFENMHVEERDFFQQPCAFMQLDLLAENLAKNSKRVLFSDMYPNVEDPLIVPLEYDLEPEHAKLYRQLAEDELLKMPDGGKIDATSANALRHALGQVIVNWDYFSGDPSKKSQAVDIIKQKLSELGDGKLIVFANYKRTAAKLKADLAEFGAVVINGEVTASHKEINIQAFINDPACRVAVIQFVSGGKGLDGFQHVCHNVLFIEPCLQPRDFWQCVFRVQRLGQTKKVVVMVATALGTTQVRGFRQLIANDELVNQVIRNKNDLADMVYGR